MGRPRRLSMVSSFSIKPLEECVREELKRAEPIVKLEAFLAWVKGRDILSGFNLTRDLTCKLFAWLDPHRKGYLNANDWLHLFGK